MGEVGVIEQLGRFPVKSMLGEELGEAELTPLGLVGDRAYAVVDAADGLVASAKHPRKWGRLLGFRATFLDAPARGAAMPPVRITTDDGTTLRSDDPGVHDLLSRVVGREVRLAATPPDDRRFEEVWPDVEGLAPDEFIARTRAAEEPSGAPVSSIGLGSAVPGPSFQDVAALHLVTTSTLERFRALAPGSDFDPRRYRPNLVLRTVEEGFLENGWAGSEIGLGADAAATGLFPTMRCVMTTLAQDGLPADRAGLRAVARHNRVEIPGLGTWACAGLYATVAWPGVVRVGDRVTVG